VTAQGGAGCIGITLVAVKPNISTTCTSVYATVSMASLFLTASATVRFAGVALLLGFTSRFPSPGVPTGSFVLPKVGVCRLLNFNRAGTAVWPGKRCPSSCWSSIPLASAASRVHPRSRLSLSIFLNRSGDVDEEVVAASAEPLRPFQPPFFFECQARCRIAKAVYAPVSMTDLKVSVTANTRHAGAPADAAASIVVNNFPGFPPPSTKCSSLLKYDAVCAASAFP
jgi:hypothetical protein